MSNFVKTVFEQKSTEDQIIISSTNDFKLKPMVDFNNKNIYVLLNFDNYDEMVTISTSIDIDNQANYSFEDNCLTINIHKDKFSSNDLKFSHKFIKKKTSDNGLRAYPSGKKPITKDWDKIMRELDVSDDETSDANDALSKIYKEVDDDTKRAMMKSLYESKGTVLNMNWEEVSKKKVENFKD